MPDTPTLGRYAEIPVEQMTPEQQAGYRFLVDGPRGRLPGPYRVWGHNGVPASGGDTPRHYIVAGRRLLDTATSIRPAPRFSPVSHT